VNAFPDHEVTVLAALNLSEKAKAALKRTFDVGTVRLRDADPRYADAIGAKALDISLSAKAIETCRTELALELNMLAEVGAIIGRRSGPFECVRADDPERLPTIEMRLMIAPGRMDEAIELIGGSSPYTKDRP
jgi:hypothetical protein